MVGDVNAFLTVPDEPLAAEVDVMVPERRRRGFGGEAVRLLLRYGRGGVNYCHHDACGDFQALLMLSTPGRDYRGGTFFLADRDPPFVTREFPFEAAGELLVFRGRGRGRVLGAALARSRRC